MAIMQSAPEKEKMVQGALQFMEDTAAANFQMELYKRWSTGLECSWDCGKQSAANVLRETWTMSGWEEKWMARTFPYNQPVHA